MSKRYSKLRFESQEDLTANSTDQEEEDEEEERKEEQGAVTSSPQSQTPPASPPTATTTPPASPPASPPLSSPTSDQSATMMLRNYHGLAQTIGGNHSCLLLVTNRSHLLELRDPVIYTRTGYNRIPPDAVIPTNGGSTYCAFRKPSIAIKGTSGVLSYEYERKGGRSKRFAVMWKVPYRMVKQGDENEVALKWLDVDMDDVMDSHTHTGLDLYNEMCRWESATGPAPSTPTQHGRRQVAHNGKCIRIFNAEEGVELDATFSGNCKAIVKVDFSQSKT